MLRRAPFGHPIADCPTPTWPKPICPKPGRATRRSPKPGQLWRRLGGDRRGLAALEFALIAPILVMAYVATAEASLALMAQRKLSLSASIAADLASHSASINVQTVNGIFAATTAVLDPFDATTLTQRLSGIVVDAGGVARVEWSLGAGMEALAVGSQVTLPANLVVADEGIVMAETALDYASPMAFTLPGTRQFSETHFVYPRVNDRVLWE